MIHAVCGYYHNLALTSSGRLYQWYTKQNYLFDLLNFFLLFCLKFFVLILLPNRGKLFKFVEGEQTEYFGMAVGLSGLQQRAKAMIDRSHNQYYAGTQLPPPHTHQKPPFGFLFCFFIFLYLYIFLAHRWYHQFNSGYDAGRG